jgi:cephalosporin-C deacetylase-like acetyl esterase/lysophospholipase L1-like esterase
MLPILLWAVAAATWTPALAAQELVITPFRSSGIYALGDTVGWSVSLRAEAGAAPSGGYTYTVRKNNLDLLKSGSLDLASGRATIELSLDEPAMIFAQITPVSGGKQIDLGAAVAPERLAPSIPRPADFDQFWQAKIRPLARLPLNPQLTPGPSERPGVDYATVRLDHVHGTHVYGQIARPAGTGKLPGLVIFQWASPPYPLQKAWVTDRAAEGWLALNIEPHDVLPDQPAAYYAALPAALKSYQTIGNDDRERSYFLQMYLADYRAIEYLASRPDWDGRTLVVMGTSMGGQQSLCAAALNPRVTGLIVNEPSGADANGPLHGRAAGYPNWPVQDERVRSTAPYFDTVNCAPRIRVPSLVSMGFVDTTSPPVGIWTVLNGIRGPKEAVPMIDSPHNHLATPEQQQPYTRRSAEWLATLREGGEVLPSADRASPRADANSQLAHQQLLRKAHEGRTDVYFLGDSITRRWGAAEEQYRALLANWRQNFSGWNAADFGWGGDTTQNILWRIQNGELDGVNPKVIVLMAGTNNVGKASPVALNEATVADVTAGIRAIIAECRRKAPGATLIVMGITPRNDYMPVMPVIEAINRNLARLADGHTVRYLNLNAQLADASGRLHTGMTDPDQLHLAVSGYQIWADALRPVLTELLGPPAATDSAPAPTGNPAAP